MELGPSRCRCNARSGGSTAFFPPAQTTGRTLLASYGYRNTYLIKATKLRVQALSLSDTHELARTPRHPNDTNSNVVVSFWA